MEESFNTDPSKLARLNIIHEQLDGKMKQLIKLDNDIVSLCSAGEIEGEIEDSEDITAKIIEAKRKIQATLKGATPELNVQSPPADTAESIASRPRLPKLTLQRFRGEITQWSSFWDSYKSAIHDNASISTIDKFNYLNSLLHS